jgi:hypothetical protein
MQDLTAKRTLVKSQPELWEELSEVERLAKHLGAFGEIRITKLEPEHKVAWEGEHASGTVSIEPSGWGTKVVLSAELTAEPDEPGEADAPEPVEDVAASLPEASATEEQAGESEPADGPPVVEIEEPATEPEPAAEPLSEADPSPTPLATPFEAPRRRRRGFWSRLFGGWRVTEERVTGTGFSPPEQLPEESSVASETPPAADEDSAPATVAEAASTAPVGPPATPVVVAAVAPPASAEETPAAEIGPDSREAADEMPVSEESGPLDSERARSVLEQTLDALGSAHHRPFSRG